jgi:WD40 repeat protein
MRGNGWELGMRWWGRGVSEALPPLPARLVQRLDLLTAIVRALSTRERPVALVGIGGAGKTALAVQACADREVRRAFRDGIVWLEAGPGKHPEALLADLAVGLDLDNAAISFSTKEQGREQLSAALRGKRTLIAIDNVCEARQLDALTGLAPKGTVLFSTRLAELARSVKAEEILVDELTPDQAMELLGRWANQAPRDLPEEARALCARVAALAIGVAAIGAMAGQGRTFADVRASIKPDPDPTGTDLDVDRYRSLFNVIEASIADLAEADQGRYAQLAVFARRGAFPRDAAWALWQSGMPDAKVDNLLAELIDRDLLMPAGEGWYIAHDLHYDVIERRLGPAGLTAAHARLLEGYRLRYTGGWAGSVTDPYLAQTLTGHLHDAHLNAELRAVLTDPAWIQARLTHGPLAALVADYGLAVDPLTRQIRRALRASAPALAGDPSLVRTQLADRLKGQPDPGITAWADGLADGQDAEPSPLTLAPPIVPLEQVLATHADPVRAVAVTPGGLRVVSGGDDGAIRIWELDQGHEQAALTGHTDWVRAVAVTPDGTRAVSGSDDGSVRIWDLDTGEEQASLTGHTGEVFSVAVTPDGSRAVTGGSDKSVRVWDLATGQELAVLDGHRRPVWSVAVTPDGARVVSGSGDGAVRIWDLTTETEQAILTGHAGEVFSVAVTPDGTRAVTGGHDGSVRVWDLLLGREQATLTGHSGWVWAVAVASDGRRAVSGGEDGSVRVWDLATGRVQATLTGHTRQVLSVAVTPDGTRAVSGGSDGSVRVWDLAAGREQAPAPAAPALASAPDSWAFSMAVTQDGTRAVTGSDDGSLRVWDLVRGRALTTFPGHRRPVWSVAVTEDGARAISGSSDKSVRVWDLATGRALATLTGHTRPVWSVAVTPEGTRAVSGSEDGSVRVWDLARGRELATLTGHTGPVLAVAVTEDGTRAVSGSEDGSVQVWDLARRRMLGSLTGHAGPVYSVAVTQDGTCAVSGSSDGSVRVWDLAAGREIGTLTGHTRPVLAVAVSPDGTLAVSGGEDVSVRVWDLTSGSEVARWPGEFPIIGCAALSGRPIKIGVGQKQGPPFVLELRKTARRREADRGERGGQQKGGSRRRAEGTGSAAAPIGTGGRRAV